MTKKKNASLVDSLKENLAFEAEEMYSLYSVYQLHDLEEFDQKELITEIRNSAKRYDDNFNKLNYALLRERLRSIGLDKNRALKTLTIDGLKKIMMDITRELMLMEQKEFNRFSGDDFEKLTALINEDEVVKAEGR